ncbi:MAG: LD-carboxypeptidase [Bacteroidetes bacterium]|nr:LD-carboxypeptidase [Bacteroidota bacterium]
MTKLPPYLKKHDTIGIVCPAGSMPLSKIKNCITTLKSWGYQVKCGNTLGKKPVYFSGTDKERLEDFQQMLDDKNIRAILCARGGYGTSRIIDQINFSIFKKNPKWIIGYSDITVLHAHIFKNFQTASLHAPMAGAFNDDLKNNEYLESLANALKGKIFSYECDSHPLNRLGKAEGELIGGNLSILAHLIGSASDLNMHGKILFFEDVDEYIYQVDRMMVQLKRSKKLENLAGILIGGFTGTKDTTVPFGKTVLETIYEHIKEYHYPVCFDFPVSHSFRNITLKHGQFHRLEVGRKKVNLEEIVCT